MTRQVIPYTITLQAPMVLTQPGGDANSADTLPYISGSTLLGALAANWKTQKTKRGHLALDQEFSEIFLQSNVRCSHAYPVWSVGNRDIRLLPSPLSLWVHKMSPTREAFDLTHEDIDKDIKKKPGLQPWQKVFVQFKADSVHHFLPEQQAMIHHQRDRDKGRATEDTGIFSYVSLSAGQKFMGYIFCERQELAHTIRQIGGQAEFFLGRSKAAQYGGNAELTFLSEKNGTDFVEQGQKIPQNSEHMVITLVSDYLGRGATGHFRSDVHTWLREFAQRLNMKERDFTFHPEFPAFARIRQISGYVAPWFMPRPIRPALEAGTVMVIKIGKTIDATKLQEMLWTGLGERRAEGFGRFVLDWHGHDDDSDAGKYLLSPIEQGSPELHVSMDSDTESLLMLSQKNMLQRVLAEKSRHFVSRITSNVNKAKIPPKSVLGRIRQRIRASTGNGQVRIFLDQFSSSDNVNKPFAKHLTDFRIGSMTLLDWLKNMYSDDAYLHNELNFDDLKSKYYLTDSEQAHNVLKQLLPQFRNYIADLMLQELSRLKKKEEEGE